MIHNQFSSLVSLLFIDWVQPGPVYQQLRQILFSQKFRFFFDVVGGGPENSVTTVETRLSTHHSHYANSLHIIHNSIEKPCCNMSRKGKFCAKTMKASLQSTVLKTLGLLECVQRRRRSDIQLSCHACQVKLVCKRGNKPLCFMQCCS